MVRPVSFQVSMSPSTPILCSENVLRNSTQVGTESERKPERVSVEGRQLAKAQYVHHVVQTGMLADHPSRCAQGSTGKGISTAGPMGDFNPLAHAAE